MDDFDELEGLQSAPSFASKLKHLCTNSETSVPSFAPSTPSNEKSNEKDSVPSGAPLVVDSIKRQRGRPRKSDISHTLPRPAASPSPAPLAATTKQEPAATGTPGIIEGKRERKRARGFSPEIEERKRASTLVDSSKTESPFAVPSTQGRGVIRSGSASSSSTPRSAYVAVSAQQQNRPFMFAALGSRFRNWSFAPFELETEFFNIIPTRLRGRTTAEEYWATEKEKASTSSPASAVAITPNPEAPQKRGRGRPRKLALPNTGNEATPVDSNLSSRESSANRPQKDMGNNEDSHRTSASGEALGFRPELGFRTGTDTDLGFRSGSHDDEDEKRKPSPAKEKPKSSGFVKLPKQSTRRSSVEGKHEQALTVSHDVIATASTYSRRPSSVSSNTDVAKREGVPSIATPVEEEPPAVEPQLFDNFGMKVKEETCASGTSADDLFEVEEKTKEAKSAVTEQPTERRSQRAVIATPKAMALLTPPVAGNKGKKESPLPSFLQSRDRPERAAKLAHQTCAPKVRPVDPSSALGIINRASKFRRQRSPTPEPPAVAKELIKKKKKSTPATPSATSEHVVDKESEDSKLSAATSADVEEETEESSSRSVDDVASKSTNDESTQATTSTSPQKADSAEVPETEVTEVDLNDSDSPSDMNELTIVDEEDNEEEEEDKGESEELARDSKEGDKPCAELAPADSPSSYYDAPEEPENEKVKVPQDKEELPNVPETIDDKTNELEAEQPVAGDLPTVTVNEGESETAAASPAKLPSPKKSASVSPAKAHSSSSTTVNEIPAATPTHDEEPSTTEASEPTPALVKPKPAAKKPRKSVKRDPMIKLRLTKRKSAPKQETPKNVPVPEKVVEPAAVSETQAAQSEPEPEPAIVKPVEPVVPSPSVDNAAAVQLTPTQTPAETPGSSGGRCRRNVNRPSWMQDFDLPSIPGSKTATPSVAKSPLESHASPSQKRSPAKTAVVYAPPTKPVPEQPTESTDSQSKSPAKEPKSPFKAVPVRSALKLKFSLRSSAGQDIISTEKSAEQFPEKDKDLKLSTEPQPHFDKVPTKKSSQPYYKPSVKPYLGLHRLADGTIENLETVVNQTVDKVLLEVTGDGISRHSCWLVKSRDVKRLRRIMANDKNALKKQIHQEAIASGAIAAPVAPVVRQQHILHPTTSLAASRQKRSVKNKYVSDESSATVSTPAKSDEEVRKEPRSVAKHDQSMKQLKLNELVKLFSVDDMSPTKEQGSPSPSSRRHSSRPPFSPTTSITMVDAPGTPSPSRHHLQTMEEFQEPGPIDKSKIAITFPEMLEEYGLNDAPIMAYGIQPKKEDKELFYRELFTSNCRPINVADSDVELDDVLDVGDADMELTEILSEQDDSTESQKTDAQVSSDVAAQICQILPRPLSTDEDGEICDWRIEDAIQRVMPHTGSDFQEDDDLLGDVLPSDREVFKKIVDIVGYQFVADCTCDPHSRHASVNYTVAQQNAQRFRDTLFVFSKARELQAYRVHRWLVMLLPEHLLASYITVLRHGKKLQNNAVSVLNRAVSNTEGGDRSMWKKIGKLMLEGCKLKVSHPETEPINRTTLSRVLSDVIAIFVEPLFSSEEFEQRSKCHELVYRTLRSLCNASSTVISLELPEYCDEKTSIAEAALAAINTIACEVRQCVRDHPKKRIVLVGWRTSTYFNHRVINMVGGISALVDFSFPTLTAFGPRGSADDDLLLTYCPTLFVEGEHSVAFDPKVMHNIQKSMIQPSGLVVVGAADANLCVDTHRLTLEGVTQRMVARAIVEQVVEFLQTDDCYQPKTELVPARLHSVFTVDQSLFKSLPYRSKKEEMEHAARSGTGSASYSSRYDEPPPRLAVHSTTQPPPPHHPAPKPKKRKHEYDQSHMDPSEFMPIRGHTSYKEMARQKFASALQNRPPMPMSRSPMVSPSLPHYPPAKKRARSPVMGRFHAEAERKDSKSAVDPASISLG